MKTPLIREAVAVFDDPEKLERAVSELQSHGVDRSQLSFLAHPSLAEGPPDDSRRLADDPAAPRESAVTDTDLRQGRILGTSLAAIIAALAASGLTVATDGVAAATVAAAAAAGGSGGHRGRRCLGRPQIGRGPDLISRRTARPRRGASLGTHSRRRSRATRARGAAALFLARASPRPAGANRVRTAAERPPLMRSGSLARVKRVRARFRRLFADAALSSAPPSVPRPSERSSAERRQRHRRADRLCAPEPY